MRIGVDLGGTKIEAVLIDSDGRELARHRIPTPRNDYAGTVAAVAGLVRELEDDSLGVASVGVGIPGSLSPATGLVRNANSVWLIGRPFDRDLSAALARPVRIANDANCFALAEARAGAGRGAALVFGVILGSGVGGGLVHDGRLIVGRNAIAGEWGHNPLPRPADDERPGPLCYCGRNGCIESFLSGPALRADHHAATGRDLDPAGIVAAAAQGDPAAEAALSRYEERLARALAAVINIVDPDVIVLGGGLSCIDRLYRNVPGVWDRHIFSDVVTTRLVPPHLGDSAGVHGAAWLWPAAETAS